MNAKELYAHIQSLTAQMDDEEKERFYDEAEKDGFWSGESLQHRSLLYWTYFLQH